MNDKDRQQIAELLWDALGEAPAPQRDLWPRMLERLAQGARRVPWYDWALAGAALGGLAARPELVVSLLYHL
jgi:hypothetical protein